jgi:hypothetical protein
VSGRRAIDDARVRALVGSDVMAKYGSLTIAKLDELLKDEDIDADTRAKVKSLIYKNYSEPKIKVEKVDE